MNSDNVIKTEPNNNGKTTAKTEPQVNNLVPIATTAATANKTANETIVVQQQDCVASSAGEQVTECNDAWVMLERVVLKLDDRNILLNDA